MKKNSQLKKKIAVFALSLTLLKAAEQKTIQIENLSLHPQEPVAALAPSVVRLTRDDVINQLSQGMDESNKGYVIRELGTVISDLYTVPFIDTVNALSQGMNGQNKGYVIEALGQVNPDHYTERFTNTVNALSQGMDEKDKWYVILALGEVNLCLYTAPFIDTVNALSQGMNGENKGYVIEALGEVNPHHYPFLQNFIRQNPRYFTDVPASHFLYSITPNMTQQELQELFKYLHFFNNTHLYTARVLKNA